MRFRINEAGNLTPTGNALNGEVEDYKINITNTSSLSPTVITTQPVGATYCQNTPAANVTNLSVAATGSGITATSYQWYSNVLSLIHI